MTTTDFSVRAPRPKSVQIGHIAWAINWDNRAVRRVQIEANENFLGRTNSNTATIHIDDFGQPEDALRATLLHEVLHAIWLTYAIDSEAEVKRERDEQYVARLEMPLLSVLRDNPLLVNYLTDPGPA